MKTDSRRTALVASAILIGLVAAGPAHAQAPGLLWTNSVIGSVFAVDEFTNVYTGTNGTVLRLDQNGVPLQTNTFNTYPGLMGRDKDGNYFYAGVLPGTYNGFGYTYTNPACFLAKYSPAGTLIWSNGFGPSGFLRVIGVKDMQFDSASNIYVGFTYNVSTTGNNSWVARFDSTGSNIWTISPPNSGIDSTAGSIKLAIVSPTNGYAVAYVFNPGYPVTGWSTVLSQFDGNGTTSPPANTNVYTVEYTSMVAPLVRNSASELYVAQTMSSSYSLLTKLDAAGNVIWQDFGDFTKWPVGRDLFDGVHVADTSQNLFRYDVEGGLVWTKALPANCTGLFVDAHGNRFVSMAGGLAGRLAAEPLLGPVITNDLRGQTVFAGSNAVISIGAGGSAPLRYCWFLNGTPLPGQTGSSITLNPVNPTNAGTYAVIVSNFVGSVTSAPALLRVKSVAIYSGSQLLTNGTWFFATPPTLSVHSAFPSGSIYYTLDGSAPSFGSTFYTGPFTPTSNVTVRAIGYSSDFLQSEEADAVNAVILAQHTLTTSTAGGGTISLNPPGGSYPETNIVTATAVPTAGWSFLYWLGNAAGASPSVDLLMNTNKVITAVFGTTFSTTAAGSGRVAVNPSAALYPYGSVVRLTGIPQPGNYFGAWGNAATGNTNPLNFVVTNPNPTVSSIFAPVPSNHASLTILINGSGQVSANPRANEYTNTQTVVLTATPVAGEPFLSWSGDASGSVNPLSVLMNQNRVITANFSNRLSLSANQASSSGLGSNGFRLTLNGLAPGNYQVFGSSNLSVWESLGIVSNQTGQVQFLDVTATNRPARYYRAAPWP